MIAVELLAAAHSGRLEPDHVEVLTDALREHEQLRDWMALDRLGASGRERDTAI